MGKLNRRVHLRCASPNPERVPKASGGELCPLAAKVQNLLIGDFLHCLAMRHGILLLPSMGDGIKKTVSELQAVNSTQIVVGNGVCTAKKICAKGL